MGKRKKFYIAMAAGSLLLFALAAAGFFFYLQPRNQVLLAAANTWKDSCFAEELKDLEWLQGDGIQVSVDWHTKALNGTLQAGIGQEENTLLFQAGALGVSIAMEGILTEEELMVNIPMAGDIVYTHHLWEDTPFFDELLGRRRAERTDKVLQELSGLHWKKMGEGKFEAKEILPLLKNGDIKKAGEAEYEIDGKKASCKGYVIEASLNPWLAGQGLDFEKIYVYVYKRKLAALRVESEKEIWEIRFLGGEKRDSKIMFVKEESFSLTLEGGRKGETFPVKIIYENPDNTHIALRGELTGHSLEAEIRSVTIQGKDSTLEGDIIVEAGGEMEKPSGEIRDLEDLEEGQKQILTVIFRLLRV